MGALVAVTATRHPSASNKVRVYWSEPANAADAGTFGNYAINNGVTVSAAAVVANTNNLQVDLTVSGLAKPTVFTLTVSNVRDIAGGVAISAPRNQAVFIWLGVGDNNLDGIPEHGGLLKTPRGRTGLIGDRPLGYNVGGIQANYRVNNAIPQSAKVVRIELNEQLRAVTPSSLYDALNPSNYTFIGGVKAVSVAFVDTRHFDITLDTEMVIGNSYTVRICGALGAGDGAYPDAPSGVDVAVFVGGGVRPTIANAVAGEQYVDVAFSEAMATATLLPSAFTVAANGGSGVAVSVVSVEIVNTAQVRLHLNARMTNGQPYRVSVTTAATDAVGNTVAGGEHFDFIGYAAGAAISNLTFLDATHVRVVFSVDVTNNASLINPASYTTTAGLIILAVVVESTRSVTLTTSTMQQGVSYSITI